MNAWAAAAGVVLAGGRSSRMGTAKAAMEWHGSTLLHRTAALLGRAVGGPVVVVSAAGQELPPLPDGVCVVTDPVPGLGPLQGVAAGLGAVRGAAATAFVCATDLPFLHPAFVRSVLAALDGAGSGITPDVALPVARGYRQPLAAGYRTALAEPITALLAAGKRRPGMLFERSHVVELDDAALLADPDLARLDPGLESVTNVNEPADYAAARARPPQPVTVAISGRGACSVRAAVLGVAAAAVGIGVTGDLVVVLNGLRVDPDPHLPLVAGDTVVLDG